MTFLKQNWFKISLLVLGILYSLLFAYSLLLATYRHALDVHIQMRLCSTTYDAPYQNDIEKRCYESVKSTIILKNIFIPSLDFARSRTLLEDILHKEPVNLDAFNR